MAKGKKPAKASASKQIAKHTQPRGNDPVNPIHLQRVLDIFQHACCDVWQDDFDTNLQQVKQHLFERNFSAAFSEDKFLAVYAARWSSSRALGYLQLLADLRPHLEPLFQSDNVAAEGTAADGREDARPHGLTITCLGGGAGAELVACSAWVSLCRRQDVSRVCPVHIRCIDIADWKQVTARLNSAMAASTDGPFNSCSKLDVSFEQQDVLSKDVILSGMALSSSSLITLMFTLNELYSTSLAKTQKLLLDLTAATESGIILLVVDSPGSYSTVTINGHEKKYPMHWLLDHTLLVTATKDDGNSVRWEKIFSDESRWFRLPDGLRYPVALENMRYQVHLYKRI